MQAIGAGWLMQNAFYFRGEAFLGQRGAEALRLAPPIGSALRKGIVIGGGTDAHRVMSYNPFVSLQWMIDGRTVAGLPTRAADETPTRLEALRLYSEGSAWFAHDDARRGSLAVGKLADLAVLSSDFLDVPMDEIGRIRSLLTMVGGRIVYAAEPYADMEARESPAE
jgi:predicted amidohydrolase YtcJ